jgi:hypothetical protein
MEKAIRFLSVCVLVSVILICGTVLAKSFIVERYYFESKESGFIRVCDNLTGRYYYVYDGVVQFVDPGNGVVGKITPAVKGK